MTRYCSELGVGTSWGSGLPSEAPQSAARETAGGWVARVARPESSTGVAGKHRAGWSRRASEKPETPTTALHGDLSWAGEGSKVWSLRRRGLRLGQGRHSPIPQTLDGDLRAGKKWPLIAKVETGFELCNFLSDSRLWDVAMPPPEGSRLF